MKNNILKNRYLIYTLLILTGVFLGWLFFHPEHNGNISETQVAATDSTDEHEHGTIWTCAMHPQIRMDHPGDCPICGMELIPLDQNNSSSIDTDAVKMTKEAAALANVLTTVVSKQKPVKEIRLYGKVQADERLFQSQVAHVPGRIEHLSVNFTGETIKRGQVLAEIYSPELITAQQELLETVKTKQIQPELYEASRERLRQWKLTDEQINEIEASGKTMNNIKVLSNTSGTITARRVNTGDHVSVGTVLYEVADLSKVWVLFDAYESDLQFLKEGRKITFNLQALPGTEFSGNISFIDPVIDPVTRVAKVRVEAPNQSGKLKPEMFATGIVSSNLSEYGNDIVIPRSAVLWTGKRSIVYVKQPGSGEPVFKLREISLGPSLGESYVVTDGLMEGEEIVTSGTFSVDASAQLEGKPSMMNTSGENGSENNQHGNMQGMQLPDQQNGERTSGTVVNTDFRKQLKNVYEKYLELKNALVNSNQQKAKQSSTELKNAVSKVDMKLLKGDTHKKWMDLSEKIAGQSDLISKGSLEEQRAAFSDLSGPMYSVVKTYGLNDKTLYYQFCPMYNNNKGAFWLSEIQDIKNPYFGEQMLTCGETKETIKQGN